MSVTRQSVAPILRWAGGKRWLVRYVEAICSVWSPNAFYEPFLGGGAVYLGFAWPSAIINDVNGDLMAMYRAIACDPERIQRRLSALTVCKEQYEDLRASAPPDDIGRAVRLLYLNRCGYGGIYRTNRQGIYNVPFSGDRSIASLWRDDRLVQLSSALGGARMMTGDFEQALVDVAAGAFVYCDPAYVLPDAKERFARYSNPVFTWKDQVRLAEVVHELGARGALVAVSGPADPRVRRLFRGALVIECERRVHLPKASRGTTAEALYILGDRQTRAGITRRLESIG